MCANVRPPTPLCVVDYGDAPTIVGTSMGEPTRLPGDLLEFPWYRLTRDGDGQLARRVVGYVICPASALAAAVLIASEAVARCGVPLVADDASISPAH